MYIYNTISKIKNLLGILNIAEAMLGELNKRLTEIIQIEELRGKDNVNE